MSTPPPRKQPYDVPLALAEPVTRVGPRWVGLISLANLALWMAYFGPLQVLLPQQVADVAPGGKETALAWVTGLGAAVAMVANPVAGALSDRTTGRFGRRHPWTLLGASTGGLALVLLAFQGTVVGVAIGWCLAQAGLNAMQAALTAGVPDHVPVGQRGAVSGWIGIPQTLGVVVAVVLVTMVVTTTESGYLLIGVLVPLCALPFVLATPDASLPAERRPPFGLAGFLRGFWISPRAHPDFAWAWLTRFLMQLGNAMVLLYLLYFLTDAVHYERVFPGSKAEDGLLVLILIYTATVVLTTVASGAISDRLGRRKTLVTVSGAISAVPAVLLAFWPQWTVVTVAAAIMGIGFGVYLSVDNALVTQVLPAAAGRAKDLGVINIANSGPQVLAPVIAGPIVASLGGYPILYLTAGTLTLLGAALVWKIRSVP
ncbi:MFS transporter [Sphaerisporangium siamense]|uniref:MFS family permease n=1 Tax=Sphaerisporangium siamense TaxID=795645 RepID=A0A7W7D9A9_9ACTN|nr:MFS transporter [Sphaerisporangium siamense]MBB4702644.1 MFS family permease [Sphaerisporangium siamense]GII83602.1 MFS transporter [Sphaerisporangium siamense]